MMSLGLVHHYNSLKCDVKLIFQFWDIISMLYYHVTCVYKKCCLGFHLQLKHFESTFLISGTHYPKNHSF